MITTMIKVAVAGVVPYAHSAEDILPASMAMNIHSLPCATKGNHINTECTIIAKINFNAMKEAFKTATHQLTLIPMAMESCAVMLTPVQVVMSWPHVPPSSSSSTPMMKARLLACMHHQHA